MRRVRFDAIDPTIQQRYAPFRRSTTVNVTLYTEQTVAQCLSALNERMHLKPTTSRPALDGWLEKSGAFSLGVSSVVVGRFSRSTYLRGRLERQNGYTVVHGSVSGGASHKDKIVIFVALALIAAALALRGSVTLALVIAPLAAALYIPLTGDHQNSETLISELQKTLKARENPPRPAKKATETVAKPRRAAARVSSLDDDSDSDL
jgi:hypothetical protein